MDIIWGAEPPQAAFGTTTYAEAPRNGTSCRSRGPPGSGMVGNTGRSDGV
jgi:hypothetical protein